MVAHHVKRRRAKEYTDGVCRSTENNGAPNESRQLMGGCWDIRAGVLPLAIAQSEFKPSTTAKQYMPRLVEIMSAAQLQHLKLWYAGTAKNWDLAAYEVLQLKDSLVEAALLYPGIPVSNVTTVMTPLQSISDAIVAKDSRRFANAVGELTDGCNTCHRSMERSFVVIRVPTNQQAPANQLFAPQGKQ